MRLASLGLTLMLLAPAATATSAEPTCFGEEATIVGGGIIAATAGNDVIVGGEGADTVTGVGNNDLVCTLGGGDRVEITGGGHRKVNEGAGDDWISYAQSEFDIRIRLDTPGKDGQEANAIDVLRGIENVEGSRFGDQISGGAGVNKLVGGGGDDTFIWAPWDTGDDEWDAGDGSDYADFMVAPGPAAVDVGSGSATVPAVPDTGTKTLSGFENMDGSVFDDTLTGHVGVNTVGFRTSPLIGDNDTISSGGGDDHIYLPERGRGAVDTGDGNDIVEGGGMGTSITLGPGDDSVSRMFAPPRAGITNSVAGGDGRDQIAASANNDTLTGDGGDDRLGGGDGDDLLDGGPGSDVMSGGAGHDVCIGENNVDATDGTCDFNGDADTSTGPPGTVPAADLSLAVSEPESNNNGDLVYTLTIANAGPDAAPGVEIDLKHDGEIAELKTPAGRSDFTCAFKHDYIFYFDHMCSTSTPLPAGQSVAFTATVAPSEAGTYNILATINTRAGGFGFDPKWSDNARHISGIQECPSSSGRRLLLQQQELCEKVTLTAPEFVERGEKFTLTAALPRRLFSCEGDKIDLLMAVNANYGIIATKDLGERCTASFDMRARRDTDFKAKRKSPSSAESPPITVKVR